MTLEELIQRIESRGWEWTLNRSGSAWDAVIAHPDWPEGSTAFRDAVAVSAESAAHALGLAFEKATTVPRANHVSEGLAAKTNEPGQSQESNAPYKPVCEAQPEAQGYFGVSEFVRDAQDGQIEAIGTTGQKAEEGGEG